eukprot:9466237-Pyramimonas_sp.AAC.1
MGLSCPDHPEHAHAFMVRCAAGVPEEVAQRERHNMLLYSWPRRWGPSRMGSEDSAASPMQR